MACKLRETSASAISKMVQITMCAVDVVVANTMR